MSEDYLLFHQPWLGKEEEREIVDTLRSGWITTGPKTKKFEQEFARYTKAKYALGLNSCTAALHLSLIAAGVKEGDEVITTPITFASTANVIIHQGAKPVFVDVEPDTLNIDPERIEERITKKTKAIIPVHFAGYPADMDRIIEIAQRHNLVVIEDAAHSIEAEYKGKKIGSIGDMTCFSFYATKNITTGEGGMLTTNNREWAEKISMLSLHGISRDAWKRYGKDGYKHWDIIYPGYKYNMFDLQAALGLAQLKKIEEFWQTRKKYTQIYREAFEDIPQIQVLSERGDIRHSYHLFVIIVKTEELRADRDTIMNEIQREGVGIGIHFRAVHLHPYYRETFGFKKGMLPNAEYAGERVISLPLYPRMSKEDVQGVISVVKGVIERF
ncbi:MAG: DegT/DnrJ/EryC1/StrS family aminotransferase [bacterium]|nr:DegT/DnrJ/EryC1/StrS family aminotransferase [bacterium]